MWRFVKWTLLSVLTLVVIGAGYGTYIVFINPSLHMTVNKQTFAMLMDNPEMLTQLGAIEGSIIDFHSGKLSDVSWEQRDRDQKRVEENLSQIEAYEPAKLEGQEKLTREVMIWFYESSLAYKDIAWSNGGGPYPVNQMFGIQNGFPRFMSFTHVVKNEKTARTYVERLNAVGVKFDQVIGVVRKQAELGDVPPTFVIDKVLTEMKGLVAMPTKENPLYTGYVESLKKIEISDADRTKFASDAEAAITGVVTPAYQRLIATMEDLRSKSTPDAGIWQKPQGDAYYALALRQQTTTDMSPQQVHDIGLAEVTRISAEMDAILIAQGMVEGTVGARMTALGEDPQYHFEDSDKGRQDILDEYTRLLDDVARRMPEAFETIPPQKVEVVRVPKFSEGGSAGAYYNAPSMDGTRPGRFFANLRDVKETPKWSMKTLAYHEGIPGHHFQISSAQNLDLPLARSRLPFTAYTEGWALYAERLAYEMGMYKDDPLGDLGRLQAELFRAVRLVVDTGMHYKKWSREQAITYMVETTGMAEGDVTAEIERYSVMPGQACAYKIGMLKILELRERAKAALGSKFDLRKFHSVVLDNGPLPLTVLEKVVDAWIAQQKTT
jgi:uncharacterized protein (DUF885 family)